MHTTRFSTSVAVAASFLLASVFVSGCEDEKAQEGGAKKGVAEAAEAGPAPKKGDTKPGGQAPAAEAASATPKGEGSEVEDKPGPSAEAGAEAAEDGAADSSGVAVCDEYIRKYAQCIEDHAPEDLKQRMKDDLAKSAERFKSQSEGPEKDTLETSCAAALDAVKKTSKDWGCTYD